MTDPIDNHRHITTRDHRDHLGRNVDAVHYAGETIVITKNGEPRAVLISVAQYRDAMEKLAALVPIALAESSDPTPNTNPDPTLEETK